MIILVVLFYPSWTSEPMSTAMSTASKEMLSEKIAGIIKEHIASNVYLGGDGMWSYYWQPKLGVKISKHGCDDSDDDDGHGDGHGDHGKNFIDAEWSHIGRGYDRDIGSCEMFVHLSTGRIICDMEYEGCLPNGISDFSSNIFDIEKCLIHQSKLTEETLY